MTKTSPFPPPPKKNNAKPTFTFISLFYKCQQRNSIEFYKQQKEINITMHS